MEKLGKNPENLKQELINKLNQFDIPIDKWGKGETKTVKHLLDEIQSGESILIRDNKNKELSRKISFLAIDVLYEDKSGQYKLVEKKQIFNDGRERVRNLDTSLGEKIKSNEIDIKDVTKRAIFEELGIIGGIKFVDNQKTIKETVDSKSYPGLKSLHTKIHVTIKLKPSQYISKGYKETQKDKTTYFVWKKI